MTPAEFTLTVAAALASLHSPEWPQSSVPPREIECLARMAYLEMGNQSPECKLIAAYVALDRYAQEPWPLTICDVVRQPEQFSPRLKRTRRMLLRDNVLERRAMDEAIDAAIMAYTGLAERPEISWGFPTHFYSGDARPEDWETVEYYIGDACGHSFWRE